MATSASGSPSSRGIEGDLWLLGPVSPHRVAILVVLGIKDHLFCRDGQVVRSGLFDALNRVLDWQVGCSGTCQRLGTRGAASLNTPLISRRHVQSAKGDSLPPGPRLFINPACNFSVIAGWESIDDLMIFNVANRCGVLAVRMGAGFDEGSFVEAKCCCLVESLTSAFSRAWP